MNPNEVSELFDRYGVLHKGHFKLSSGRHSDTYLQCARILEHPRVAASLGEAIAKRYPQGADVVVSPALGGILIGNAVAYAIGCRFLFAERADNAMTLRRGQTVSPGERVIVVEDVITTGGSAAEVIGLCEDAGAKVVGVGALVDRSHGEARFHLEALLKVDAKTWDPTDCPLCVRGQPLHTPGSRGMSKAGPSAGSSP